MREVFAQSNFQFPFSQSQIVNQKWHVAHSTETFRALWQLTQNPMFILTDRTATVRCRMSPWQTAQSTLFRMCGA